RVLAGEGQAKLGDLTRRSDILHLMLAAESAAGPEMPWQRPYGALHRGDLDGALSASKAVGDATRLLRLVAASDGASNEVVERALALPPNEGLDEDTLLPALALATLNKRDVSGLVAAIPTIAPRDGDRVLAAFEAVRKQGDRSAIESVVRGLTPEDRGRV